MRFRVVSESNKFFCASNFDAVFAIGAGRIPFVHDFVTSMAQSPNAEQRYVRVWEVLSHCGEAVLIILLAGQQAD